MKHGKRGLAWLLALLLLVSALPVTAAAEGETEEESLEGEPLEEVIYYYGDPASAVVVTRDASKADTLDEEGRSFVVFEEDGSYSIPLPSQTEFPAVVHFLADEQDYPIVFGSVSATAEVGGHLFGVCLEEPEPEEKPEEPLDLYIDIDGQKVDLAPSEMQPLSMQPLEEKYYTLDLTDYFPDELKSVNVSDMLKQLKTRYSSSSPTQDPSKVAALLKFYYYDEDGNYISRNDDYIVVGEDMTLDLSDYHRSSGTSTYTMELIIGTADPLDSSNQRYIVEVWARGEIGYDLLDAAAYSTSSPRSQIKIYEAELSRHSYMQNGSYNESCILDMVVDPKTWQSGQEVYLSLKLKDLRGLTAKVYEGRYETAEELAGAKEITDQIWEQNSLSTTGGYRVDCSSREDDRNIPVVTLALTRSSSGKTVLVLPFALCMSESRISLSWGRIYADGKGSSGRKDITSSYENENRDYTRRIYTLDPGYAADGQYYFHMRLNNPASKDKSGYGLDSVKKAVVGHYETEAQIPSSAEDIKNQLFSSPYSKGYKADFSKGVSFTIVDVEGGIYRRYVKTVADTSVVEEQLPPAPTPLSEDTYFRMQGAKGLNAYVMPYNADSYYFNGFQTVLLLDGSGPVTNSREITPNFYAGGKVDVRLGHNVGGNLSGGERQTSGESKVTFKNEEVLLYSAAAENGKALKNYWVTFLTQQPGAKLFVNGINDDTRKKDEETGDPIREVFLTGDYDYHHDIFFANIGSQTLTGLKVELLDAQNIRLDDYWTIHQDGTTTLAPFTKTSYGDELQNVSKIRLMPIVKDGVVQSGKVSGTLKISSANGGSVSIKLKGSAGAPQIVTDILPQGVKFVHYSSLIQTNSMYGSNSTRFSLAPGSNLSSIGLNLKPNGEIYGIPTREVTNYKFTVVAEFSGEVSATDSKEFSLTIRPNTDENVAWATESENQGYPFEPYGTGNGMIPNQSSTMTDQVFHSSGDFSQFMNFSLDGRLLSKGTDYVVEEGSTKITVRAQTFRNAGNGTHTISAEFRTGASADGVMHRTAQNFTISGLSGGGSSGGGSSSGGSSSGSSTRKPSTSKPTVTPGKKPAETPTVKKTVADVMRDIEATQWFFPDVDWAYQKGLMIGVNSNTYAPYGTISPATVTVVLSRLNGADLSRWANETAEGVTPDQWYSAAASWARECGLLPEGPFTVTPAMTRGQMAVMLVKYLKYLGFECVLPAKQVAFTDAALMTEDENAAFQVLYQYGIFKGIGNYTMDVSGPTTRAQFAVLMHRLSVFVGE